jgi:GTPase SAR1 family protein
MGKFGRKVNVATDLSKYMIGVMAPSGFGKTTLMYQVCEKEFGPDGYIILDMAQEDGVAALQGAVAEKVTTWKKMKEVVDDIVKNKATDYPDLKVVILDTLDAAFEAAEQYAVDTYNRENMGKQGFTKASSINSVEGGFGRGLEKVIEYVKKEIIRLQSVGVGVYWTAHVKEKDQTDLFTGTQYTTLTANMSMKYFNAIKNSSHVVAFGYFDRSIEKQAVGEVNPITKKAKERKSVLAEARKLKFRDDAMIADAKSRFSEITDEIDLDADLFIKAIKDAIEAERVKGSGAPVSKVTKKAIPAPVIVEEESIEEDEDTSEIPFDLDDDLDSEVEVDFAALRTEIRNKNKSGTAEQKKQVKAIIASTGKKLDEIEDVEVLTRILEIFE